MKKFFCFGAVLLLILSLAACGSRTPPDSETRSSSAGEASATLDGRDPSVSSEEPERLEDEEKKFLSHIFLILGIPGKLPS